MDIHSRICNLCLFKCKDFKFIKEDRKTVLDVLLPIKEFTPIQEPVICTNCEKTLRKCFGFKSKCLHSYDYVVSLVNGKDADKLDLTDVYLSQNVVNTDVSVDQNVCCFCMCLVENCYAVSLEVDVKGRDIILQKMMGQCLPELDISIIKNPVICADCHRSLENCFRFVTNCLTAEEKIKKYCESLDAKSRDPIELSGLLHSTMRTVEESDTVVITKAEEPFFVKVENTEEIEIFNAGDFIKLEHTSRNDSQCVNESESFMSLDNRKVNSTQLITPKNMQTCVEEGNVLGTFKIEETLCAENQTADLNFGEMDVKKCILKEEEIEIKSDEPDLNRFDENTTQTSVNTKINRMQKCVKSYLEEELLKPHTKQTLMKKKNIPKITYQCESCLFQTKFRSSLYRHLLLHKASSEVTMLKCDSCPFETRHKLSLKVHMSKHVDSTEVPMLNCDICLYKTIHKINLKQHLKAHESSSKVTVFKCDSCPFETKRKTILKKHMLKHMDPSEVTVFKCDFCSYQTLYKEGLAQHLITHKALSEVTVFECNSCSYKTRWKSNLRGHMLTHMDPSKVTTFTCDFCPFQTIYKKCLKGHLRTHKDPSKVTRLRCDSCSFQTRRKYHFLKHVNPSEGTMFNCDFCSYETKHKECLNYHLITHKAPSKITVFKCEFCPYQTKFKASRNRHMLTHKSP